MLAIETEACSGGVDPVRLVTTITLAMRASSRNLQITYKLASDIYVSFATSDFASSAGAGLGASGVSGGGA